MIGFLSDWAWDRYAEAVEPQPLMNGIWLPPRKRCGKSNEEGEGPDAESTVRRLECFGLLALQVDQRLKVVVFRCAEAGQST